MVFRHRRPQRKDQDLQVETYKFLVPAAARSQMMDEIIRLLHCATVYQLDSSFSTFWGK